MGAFLKFNRGLLQLPVPVKAWLVVLVAGNMIVPLFLLGRVETRVVLGVFVASAMLMTLLTALVGFTRLLGIGHVLWLPLLYYLWTRLGQVPATDFFGYWVRGVMLVNGVSLILDVLDVLRYVGGDRAEMVEGL
jgi:hypothetical protein